MPMIPLRSFVSSVSETPHSYISPIYCYDDHHNHLALLVITILHYDFSFPMSRHEVHSCSVGASAVLIRSLISIPAFLRFHLIGQHCFILYFYRIFLSLWLSTIVILHINATSWVRFLLVSLPDEWNENDTGHKNYGMHSSASFC